MDDLNSRRSCADDCDGLVAERGTSVGPLGCMQLLTFILLMAWQGGCVASSTGLPICEPSTTDAWVLVSDKKGAVAFF